MADYVKYVRELVGNKKIIMVVAGAFVFNSKGHLLLHQRTDNGFWGFPGGYMELGETVAETARAKFLKKQGCHLDKWNCLEYTPALRENGRCQMDTRLQT